MLDEERATLNFATFPAITQALLNHPDYHPDRWRGIRVINNVAPPDTLRDMQSRMPHTIQISSYGLTECGGVVAFNDPEDTLEQRCTTSGIPFDGIEVEVRDLVSGEPAPPGVAGEIVVRGYCVFDRYHKDPERTAEAVDADGWFHTGDIGSMTAEGRISYLGRTKDMLKVGGENVAAIEIESFIATHPCVSIVAVVGVPDAKYMEVPAAFIELRPGQRCDRGRDHRVLPDRAGAVQGPPPRPLHRRVADVGHQDPEVPPPGAADPRARRSPRGQHLTGPTDADGRSRRLWRRRSECPGNQTRFDQPYA